MAVHVALGAVLFVVVMVVTAALFVGWVVVNLVRGLFRLVAGPSRPAPPPVHQFDSIICDREHCRAINPAPARFCRRCGSPLEAGANRRAAV
jgi:hypothetical protein